MSAVMAVLGLATSLGATPTDSGELRREALMSALRSGGYTILLRHTRTDRTRITGIDTAAVDRDSQRNLSDDGVRDALLIGMVMRKFQVPIGEIIASPMYRTRETAEYAFGPPALAMELRTLQPTQAQRAMVAARPAPGTNRALVTHHFVIEHWAPGIKPGDIAESEAVVLRTEPGGTITLVGRILLPDWEALAGLPPTPAVASPAASPPPAAPHSPHAPPAAADPVALPATAPGRLADAYLRAFNSGDPAQMREFLAHRMVADTARTTEQRVAGYQQLFEDHGPMTILAVVSSSATELVLKARSRRPEFTLTVTTSPDHADRGRTIRFAAPGAH